jgi:hypothetical protein
VLDLSLAVRERVLCPEAPLPAAAAGPGAPESYAASISGASYGALHPIPAARAALIFVSGRAARHHCRRC